VNFVPNQIIVLKFGGSVLRDVASLRGAVHEIYRWRRHGVKVVAVVSALAGETDRLLSLCERVCEDVSGYAKAGVAAIGELTSAGLLGVQLERAGIPACVITPAAASLVATGDPFDSTPVRVNARVIHEALDRDGVVVFPGFVAVDEQARLVLLGRGGSDLSALFLAAELGNTRCRLIKDVDGLYERDPAGAHPPPPRFDYATWDDALRTDGSIIQYKATTFAKSRGLAFELGAINSEHVTHIGPGPTRVVAGSSRPAPRTVALLGAGVVGGGVFELLSQWPSFVRVVAAAVTNPAKHSLPGVQLSTDPLAVASRGCDIVIEAMGGIDGPRAAITRALEGGSHVITANKAVIAAHGAELHALAKRRGLRLLHSAAVGGSTTVLEAIASRPGTRLTRVRGILNGTTNFVLNRLVQGDTLAAAVKEAQHRGFAEADPSRDLGGIDALDKLRVIALAAGLGEIREPKLETLNDAALARLASRDPRANLRHVASLDATGPNLIASVQLQALQAPDPLFDIPGAKNAVQLEWSDGHTHTLHGSGAGRWPTSESVVGDVFELLRHTPANAAEAAA
jgi:homoserine dehydrogenase